MPYYLKSMLAMLLLTSSYAAAQQLPQQQPQQSPQQTPQQEPQRAPQRQPQQEPQPQRDPRQAPRQQQPQPARQQLQQEESVVSEDGGLVIEAYGNDEDARLLRVGFGGPVDGGFGFIYLGHFQTEGRGAIRSGSSSELPSSQTNRYKSTRLGLYAEGQDTNTGEGFGFGTFLYYNRSDMLIDRYGLGATLDLAYTIADRIRLSGGADVMPEYLSTDWDADALLEYEWHGDLRLILHPNVNVGVNWRAGRTNDTGLSTRQYEEITAGFRVLF